MTNDLEMLSKQHQSEELIWSQAMWLCGVKTCYQRLRFCLRSATVTVD